MTLIFLIKPLVETSNVIRFDSITDLMYSTAVLHEVFFPGVFFFLQHHLGNKLYTPGLNSLNESRLLLLHAYCSGNSTNVY